MCSVADAESVALWKAISLAEKQTGRIEILTDSKWAIQDTLHPLPNRELSHRIKTILVKARGRIKIKHISAHSGNPGNSLADVLAKSFREKETLDPYMGRIISIDELKKHMEEWEQNQWTLKMNHISNKNGKGTLHYGRTYRKSHAELTNESSNYSPAMETSEI